MLGVFCRRFGVPLIEGCTLRLPRFLGVGRSLVLILTGRSVTAIEALRIGFVIRVVPPVQARAAAVGLACALAELPQICLRSDRAVALDATSLTAEDAMANEFLHGLRVLSAVGFAAGVERFGDGSVRGGNLAWRAAASCLFWDAPMSEWPWWRGRRRWSVAGIRLHRPR